MNISRASGRCRSSAWPGPATKPRGCGGSPEPAVPWLSFANGPGGQPLGLPPKSN